MTTVVQVTRTERAAARLRRELDKRAGRRTDPRVEVIANAEVVNGHDTAQATETAVVTEAPQDDSASGLVLRDEDVIAKMEH